MATLVTSLTPCLAYILLAAPGAIAGSSPSLMSCSVMNAMLFSLYPLSILLLRFLAASATCLVYPIEELRKTVSIAVA